MSNTISNSEIAVNNFYPYAKNTKTFEGFKTEIYPGKYKKEPTIGYGFNLKSPIFKGMSREYILANAEELFAKTYLRARFDAADFVGYDTFNKLSKERQAVLTDMAYNMGPTSLGKFKEFRKALQAGNFKKSAAEMKNSLWYGQVGDRSKKLIKVMQEDKWD